MDGVGRLAELTELRRERLKVVVARQLPLDVAEVAEEHGRDVRLVEAYRYLSVELRDELSDAVEQRLPFVLSEARVIDENYQVE